MLKYTDIHAFAYLSIRAHTTMNTRARTHSQISAAIVQRFWPEEPECPWYGYVLTAMSQERRLICMHKYRHACRGERVCVFYSRGKPSTCERGTPFTEMGGTRSICRECDGNRRDRGSTGRRDEVSFGGVARNFMQRRQTHQEPTTQTKSQLRGLFSSRWPELRTQAERANKQKRKDSTQWIQA